MWPAASCEAHPGCTTQHTTAPNKDYRFDSALRLRKGLEALLGAAIQRQVWLLFFDREHRLLEPLMPMNDHPASPHELCDTADLGRVPFMRVLVDRAGSIVTLVQAASLVFVWERPGDAMLTHDDETWSVAAKREASRAGLDVRAQFVLHDTGITEISDAALCEVDGK